MVKEVDVDLPTPDQVSIRCVLTFLYEGLSVCLSVHLSICSLASQQLDPSVLNFYYHIVFHIFSVIFRVIAEMLMDRYRTNGQTDARTTDGRMDRQDASKTVENYCDCVLIHFGFVHLSAVQYDILRLSALKN